MSHENILHKSIALLEDLEKRKVPFRQLQKLLTQFELDNGPGWMPIKQKWCETFTANKNNLPKLEENYQSLVHIAEIFAKYNNKTIYIFKLEKNDVEQFEKLLNDLYSETGSIKDKINQYLPLSLPESEIEQIIKQNTSEPFFISKEEKNNKIIIQSVTFNNFQVRVEVENDDLIDQINQDYSEIFDTIIGYKSEYNQASDMIILDKKYKKLYLCIDNNLPQSMMKCDLVAAEYIKLLQFKLPSYQFRYQRLSLVEKVRELYSDRTYESCVVELNHHTSTNSNKKEKMSNNKDLREEEYHNKGYESIDFNSELYYIKIIYKVRKDVVLELTIPGALKNTNWDNRAVLNGCTTLQDVELLLDKLIFTITE